jgi:hypothetical protein
MLPVTQDCGVGLIGWQLQLGYVARAPSPAAFDFALPQ